MNSDRQTLSPLNPSGLMPDAGALNEQLPRPSRSAPQRSEDTRSRGPARSAALINIRGRFGKTRVGGS